MMYLFILISIIILSVVLTGLVRSYAIKKSVLDIPNNRSLHSSPTPRGGGLVIVICSIACLIYLYFIGQFKVSTVLAIVPSFCLVALIAWADDHKHIPIVIRVFAYLVSACWLVFFSGIHQNYILSLFFVFSILWLINLYNFMDGIDGLAALEAITTSAFAAIIFYELNADGLFLFALVVLGSTAGFLFWNWPPAKIFMGDVGSCSLGFIFSIMAILAYQNNVMHISVWLVLLSVFIADTSFTLMKRIVKGEKWYFAHKDHAYQKLIEYGHSHRTVALSITLLNIICLWPLAYYLAHNSKHFLIAVFINYCILGVLWLYIHNLSVGTKDSF